MERRSRVCWEGALYPNIHFLNRQAAREKVAAKKALTEAARLHHLTLAEDYQKRAEEARAAGA